jgi:ribonuclease-3
VAPDSLQQCQQLIGYQFQSQELLALALTHASVAPSRLASNERLEFLGDAVLGLVVCEELYRSCGDLLEGEMTRIKSAVVSRHTCAAVAVEADLCRTMSLGKGMAADLPQSVAAAVLEALIGAIYLDGGLEPAREFILRAMRPHIEAVLADERMQNFKSLLQQHAQRTYGQTPEYLLLDEKGPDHSKCFEIAVSIGGRHFPTAWGKSKKEAEQKAAHEALSALEAEEAAAKARA